MRLLVLSDLHVEFCPFHPADPDLYDVIILAGDIHTKGRSAQWAREHCQKTVVIVAGNHELYGSSWNKAFSRLASDATGHVHFLEQRSVVIEGVRFIGCAGWTDFEMTGNCPLAMLEAQAQMNDYKQIRLEPGYQRITPQFIRRQAQLSREWLFKEISKPHSGRTIIVTHHPPLMQFVPDYGQHPHLSAAYGNEWQEFLSLDIDLWVFGHTHWPIDEVVSGIRFISNPRGYPSEDLEFNSELVVQI